MVRDYAAVWEALLPLPCPRDMFNEFMADCAWDDFFWHNGATRGWWE